jgi:hypothetical protein
LFSLAPTYFLTACSPGKYNPTALLALDTLIDDMAKRQMRVIITLGDNWGPLDGKDKYAQWCDSFPAFAL